MPLNNIIPYGCKINKSRKIVSQQIYITNSWISSSICHWIRAAFSKFVISRINARSQSKKGSTKNHTHKDSKWSASSGFWEKFRFFYSTEISVLIIGFFSFAEIVSCFFDIRLSIGCYIQFFINFINIRRVYDPAIQLMVSLCHTHLRFGEVNFFVIFMGKAHFDEAWGFSFLHLGWGIPLFIYFFVFSFNSLLIFNSL